MFLPKTNTELHHSANGKHWLFLNPGLRLFILTAIIIAGFAGTTVAQTTTVVTICPTCATVAGPGTGLLWPVPAGVVNVKVEAWGAGGGGGGANGSSDDQVERAGGGGGGGAFKAINSVTVTPSTNVTYAIGGGGTGDDGDGAKGTDGGPTTFETVTANGGTGGNTGNGSTYAGGGGAGATAAGGDANHNGGTGGTAPVDDEGGGDVIEDPDAGGGGGGGAGSTGNGGNSGSGTGAGAAGAGGGGAGAAGPGSHGPGTNGVTPGGGGSGGYTNTNTDDINQTGGTGGHGQLRITYTLPGAPTTPNLDAADDLGTSNSDNLTSQSAGLTFTGTCDASGSVTVQLYDGTSIIPGAVDTDVTSGNYSITTTLLQGSYSVVARAIHSSGNYTNSGGLALTVDTTPPAVVLTDSDAGDNIVRDADANITITATFTDANGLANSPTINIGSVVTAGVMNNTGAGVWEYVWNIPAGNDGTHAVTFNTLTDNAGNLPGTPTAGVGGTASWIVDNTGPAVTLNDSDAGDNIVKDSDGNILFTATFTDANGLVGTPTIDIGTVVDDGVMASGGGDVWTYTWNPPAGDHVGQSVSFTGVTDVAGNPSAAPSAILNGTTSWIIDNTGPTVTLNDTDGGDDIVKNSDANITFTVTYTDAHGFAGTPTIDIGTVVTDGTMTAGAAGVWTYVWDIPAGDYTGQTVTVDGVTDAAGNASGALTSVGNGTLTWIIDNTAPAVTLNDSDAGDNIVKDADANILFTASFTDAHGLSGSPVIDIGTVVNNGVMGSSGGGVYTYTWNIPSGDATGQAVTFESITDVAGNPAAAPTAVLDGTLSWIIDNTGPAVTLNDSDAGDNIVKDSDPNILFTATFTDAHGLAGAPVIDIGTVVNNGVMGSSGGGVYTYTWNIPGGDEVGQAVTFEGLTDVAGNSAAAPTPILNGTVSWIIDNTAPNISVASDATPALPGLKIGDQIVFTVTPDDQDANLTIAPTTAGYNTGNLVWSTVDGTEYTATYTVVANHPDQFPPLNLAGVTATDVAGNVSAPVATSNVLKTIDAHVPAAPAATAAVNGGSAVAGWYNLSNNGITFTVPIATVGSDFSLMGGMVEVLMDNELNPGFSQVGGDQIIMAQGTNMVFTIDHATLIVNAAYGEGRTLEFRIRITDASGNATTTGTLAFQPQVDRTIPANPTVTDLDATTDSFGGAPGSVGTNSDNKTNSTNPLIHGTSETGTSVSIYTNYPFATFVTSGVAAAGAFSINLGNIVEGPHTLSAVAVDQAGNQSAASGATLNIEVNRTKPTITSVNFSDNGGNNETIVISFSKTIDIGNGQTLAIGNPGFSVSQGSIGASNYTTVSNTVTLTSNANLQWRQQTTNWTYADAGSAGSYIYDEFGNQLADVNNFTSSDGTPPFIITGIVFDPNGSGPERVSFNVSEELSLSEGQVIPASQPSAFHDTQAYRNTTYTGKGTTNTLTLESGFDGEWNEGNIRIGGTVPNRLFWYNGLFVPVVDASSTPNQLLTFSNEPTLFWRVNISSNNANTAFAKTGDQITLLISSNKVLSGTPIVTMEGVPVTVTPTVANEWTATLTTTGAFPDGVVDFVITALESGKTTVVTKTTNSSTVTFDKITPIISAVSISSNNANSSALAKVSNVVTVLFTVSESVPTPGATIGGLSATVTNLGGFNWMAQRTLTGAEPEGILAFNISVPDFAGNATSANAITTGVDVDFDKTVPTVTSFTLTDTNPNNTTSVDFDVVFSEDVTGVNAGDFQTFGVASGGTETIGVTGSGTTYTVTVSNISKSGALGIQIVDNNSIEDDADNFLGGPGVQGPFPSAAYTIFFPEPTNHATAFAVAGAPFVTTTSLRVTWTDAIGLTLPTSYLITVERFGGTALVPVDGNQYTDQPNLVGFPQGLLNRPAGVGFADFGNLLSGESYTFKIYSYTNTGAATDYKLDGVIPFTVGVPPTAPFSTVYLWGEYFGQIAATTMTSATTAPVNMQIYVADDDFGNGDNASTKVSKIRIQRAGAVVDWKDALAEVNITRGGITKPGTIALTGDYIEFDNLYVQGSETFGEVADGDLVVYDIQVVLNPAMTQALKNTIDGTTFQFFVDAEANVTFAAGSTGLYTGFNFDFGTSSTNNQVAVSADRLVFETEPPLTPTPVYVLAPLAITPKVRAVDIHGFTDEGYTNNLTVSATTCGVSPNSIATSPSGGVFTFPGSFRYTNDGTPAPGNGTLTVSGPGVGSKSSGQVDVIYSDDVTITNAVDDEPALMSSLAVGSNAHMAFSFVVTDDVIDGAPTLIQGLKISRLTTANEVPDWGAALLGASLTDGTSSFFLAASNINADEIIFTGIGTAAGTGLASLGYVATGTPKTYRLYIWLDPALADPLPVDIDGMNFGFEILDENITLDVDGSYFDGAQASNSNQFGARNIVSVVADRLLYIDEPANDLLVNVDLIDQLPVPVVEATDAYGRRDREYESTTITVNNDKGLLMSGTPAGTDFNAGLLTFPGTFRFTTIGTNVRLTVASTGLSVVANTAPSSLFNVRVANSATITAGTGAEPLTISSLVDTDPEKIQVFDFTVNDDPSGTPPNQDDGNPTLITEIKITQLGSGHNTIANWNNVIAAAELTDGSDTHVGSINANDITFAAIPIGASDLGYIADGTTVTPSSKTYQLLIYLKTDIEVTEPLPVDGLKFAFEVITSNIVTDPTGTSLLASEDENSGTATNIIDVQATQIDFLSAIPPSVSINTLFTPPIYVEARDVNGNRDVNFTGAITAFGTIAPPTVPPVQTSNNPTGSFAAGTFTFPANFQFTTDGNSESGKGTLVLTSGSISGQSPSITITSSFDSQLTFDASGPSGSIPYIGYQDTDIEFDGNSVVLARLRLTDGTAIGDIDGANTNLTSLTISVTNPSNLRRVALFDNLNNEIAGTEQAVTGSTITFTPSSAIEAVDTQTGTQGITDFTIRASFKNNATDVHDHDPINLQITNVTTAPGSQFLIGAGFIGGVSGGSIAPGQSIEVLATQIDFLIDPARYAGIDQPTTEPEAHARDANQIVDLDVTGPVAGAATVLSPTAGFTSAPGAFNLGILQFPGFQYSGIGDGTLTINASNALASPITGTSTAVDVIHVATALATNGVYTLNLGGGVKDKVIFGVTFESAHGTTTEPFLNEFTISFETDGAITGVLDNPRVYESTDNSYNEGLDQDVALNYGAVLTAGTKSVRVVFPTPRDLSQNPSANSGALTYFLKIDVAESANPSTPEIRPKLEDAGFGDPTDGNIVTSVGSATSDDNIEGISYNFAAVLAPTVVSSYPARGQLNIDPTQPELELVFSVPVWTLDRKAKLYKKRTGAFVQELTALNGFYDETLLPDPHAAPDNKASLAGTALNPLRFALPVLDSNEEYYVTMEPGFEPAQGTVAAATGVMDEFGNLSLGFSFSEVLFFKTVNPVPPSLIRSVQLTTVTSITQAGAVVNGLFDQPGRAYFMVVPNGNPAPTNAQIKGSTVYGGTVTNRGDFAISQTSPFSQYGIINAPLGAGTYNVWMYAESYSSKNHVDTPIPTGAPYGNAATLHGVGLTGPTLTFTGPAGSPASVQVNPPTIKMCTNSYQTLSSPIVIVEGNTNNNFDTGGSVRTFNLLLPTGFQFDISTVDGSPNGAPLYGTIDVIGADFDPIDAPTVDVPVPPVVGRLSFINNSILRVQFANSGSASKDKITITGLKVFATGSGNGSLTRLGGTAIPGVIDETVFATLIATDAPVIGFTNAYTEAEFPTRPKGQEVTIIPDNYNNPSFSVQLIPEPAAGDFGPSSFSGSGVNINILNLTAVTLGVPFNITITHTDNNGCVSESPVQYTVYDHTSAIGQLSTEYCIENENFPAAASVGLSGNIKTIPHNNNPATFMTTLATSLPHHALSAGSATQIMHGPDWQSIINASLLVQGAPTYPFAGDINKPSHSYTFDVATILNANTAFTTIPDPYSHFRKTTQSGGVYYEGGSLGKIEFTANYRSVANSQAEYPLKQEVEFWLPPIPLIEVSSNVANVSLSTTTYCQLGGTIAINGWPAATPGTSTGSFALFDDATDAPLGTAGFADLGNGTATINPTLLFNNYRDIRIEYTYKLNASPCERAGELVIRVTPNPIAAFTSTAPACIDKAVTFDGSTSNFGSVTGFTITEWNWKFDDQANSSSSNPNETAGTTAQHTYVLSALYQPVLSVKSSFGCASADLPKTVRVGAIPVVDFEFRGISTADIMSFTNLSTIPSAASVTDGFARLDWTFDDGQTEVITSGFTTPATNQYTTPGHYDVNLHVTSVIGCTSDLTKNLIVLERKVITDASSYEERFTSSNGNWQVASYDPLSPVQPSWTWGEPGALNNDITLDDLNEGKLWITTNASGTYNGNEKSAIYSPSLDMSDPALSRPMISLLTSRALAEGDGVVLEYSLDNRNVADPAKTWTVLIDGFADGQATGDEWFNAQGLASQPGGKQTTGYGWSLTSGEWKESKHILDKIPNTPSTARSNVVFRLALSSVSATPGKEGFAFDNVRIGNRTRTVLLENFSNLGTADMTTDKNGNPVTIEKFESDSLKVFRSDDAGTRLVKIIYHVSFPRQDPFNEDNPQDPSARALYYGIKNTPRARLDGETPNDDQRFSSWGDRQYNLQTLKLSEARLIPTATVQNGTITVNVGVQAIIQGKEVPQGTILHVALVEKSIARSAMSPSQDPMVKTGESSFEYVLKKMLPSAIGTKLDQPVAFGDPILNVGPLTWEPDLSKLYLEQNDLAVVVFLQDELTRKVYQTEIIDVNDPGIVTGLEDGLRIEDIAVYPNPANQEMNVMLPRNAIGQVRLKLIDQMGKSVVTGAIPDGERSRNMDVQDLASGVYILHVEENGRTTFKKVMVVH